MQYQQFLRSFAVLLGAALFFSCGGSSSQNDPAPEESAGISIQGVVVSDGNEALSRLIEPLVKRAIPSCPDNAEGGYSFTVEPSDGSLKIATQFVRLIFETPMGSGEEISTYYEIPGCTHTAAEAEAAPVTIGPTATTICAENGQIATAAIASYSGIEMAIYWVEMTLPMIVPSISGELADYRLRVHYNMGEGGTWPRDITLYDPTAAQWAWINTDDMSLTYVDEGRPDAWLDAFSDDDFWCADCDDAANDAVCTDYEPNRLPCSSVENPTWSYKDPVVLSTVVGDVGGSDFHLAAPFTIASAEESKMLTMSFDLGGGLAVWEAEEDIGDAEHTFDIENDCGLHPTFPSVEITESSE